MRTDVTPDHVARLALDAGLPRESLDLEALAPRVQALLSALDAACEQLADSTPFGER